MGGNQGDLRQRFKGGDAKAAIVCLLAGEFVNVFILVWKTSTQRSRGIGSPPSISHPAARGNHISWKR
eukprot:2160645-Amphidinium_carterae.1